MASGKDFEVAVIGGGIAGLTLAIALLERNIKVTIYEQAHKFGEIGAGVSFGPNAVQAMRICDLRIYDAFERVCTYNTWPSKRKVWFDFLDGVAPHMDSHGHQDPLFTVTTGLGQNGVHRAHYIDELMRLFPETLTRFEHHLSNISENKQDGQLVLEFSNGTTAEADAVIGCDGIKSSVRQILVGADHPSAHPVYTHEYAYRAVVPMEQAVATVGEERAQNSSFYLGPDGHVLTFPVDQGKIFNLVAFKKDPNDWPDSDHLTRPGHREDALRDFDSFGPNVKALLKLCPPELSVWAIFDTGDHPLRTYSKGRVCVSGDAAHATSPHHGSGAGFCLEDSAVLAELLGDPRVKTSRDLEAAFAAFDACRRERTQWLVQSSRFIGKGWDLRAEAVGHDFEALEREINERHRVIMEADVEKMCDDARAELGKRLT